MESNIQHRSLTARGFLQLRESGDNSSRVIEGYAVRFNTPSEAFYDDGEVSIREIIEPSAITRDLLDHSDIKLTLFHDSQLLLARSENGAGTLAYEVDESGVKFRCELPNTVDGDKALELVRRGDLWGCSFAFSTRYSDRDFVERSVAYGEDGHKDVTYRVKRMTGIYDFSIVGDPAYRDTSVEARGLLKDIPAAPEAAEKELREKLAKQYDELTELTKPIFF